jgi:hypothetical protein
MSNLAEQFRLDPNLLLPKLEEISRAMNERAVAGTGNIRAVIRKSGNTAGYWPRFFELHEKLAEEWATKLFDAHCETWKEQNGVVSPAFIKWVRDTKIIPMIKQRQSTVISPLSRLRRPPDGIAMRGWSLRMGKLVAQWNRKLEAEAVRLKYRSVERPQQQTNTNSSNVLTQSKGRPPKRAADFCARAGELWTEALKHATGKKVSADQLAEIASELDRLKFVPPGEYLESSFASQVKTFNRNHSNAKRGPIKTWSKLVEHADKDHLRGMRKLLSRCAKSFRRPLSGK